MKTNKTILIIFPLLWLLNHSIMAQPSYKIESVWGGSVTLRYVGLEEFPELIKKYRPQGKDLPQKLITIQYFEIPDGVLVQEYWGPSGLLLEKIEDFHWMESQGISIIPDHDQKTIYHFQNISTKEDILKFLVQNEDVFEKVDETQYENILQSEDGRVAFVSKNNTTCFIYPSKEVFLMDMKNFNNPIFLAVPGESEDQ